MAHQNMSQETKRIFNKKAGVWVDIAWGLIALSTLSAEQAIVARQSVPKAIGRNVGLAVIIIVFSALAGAGIDALFT